MQATRTSSSSCFQFTCRRTTNARTEAISKPHLKALRTLNVDGSQRSFHGLQSAVLHSVISCCLNSLNLARQAETRESSARFSFTLSVSCRTRGVFLDAQNGWANRRSLNYSTSVMPSSSFSPSSQCQICVGTRVSPESTHQGY